MKMGRKVSIHYIKMLCRVLKVNGLIFINHRDNDDLLINKLMNCVTYTLINNTHHMSGPWITISGKFSAKYHKM